MNVRDPEFQKHPVFQELAEHVEFYGLLAHQVFHWLPGGTSSIWNIDSYVLSSMQGTLASIRLVLQEGRINDAYALLRKLFDAAVVSVYVMLYVDDHRSLDNPIVRQVDDWVTGMAQLPSNKEMQAYIRKSPSLAPVMTVLETGGRYKKLRDRCNSHTHYNFFAHLIANDNEIVMRYRGRSLSRLLVDVRDVLVFHLGCLFHIRQHYMASSDYADYMDCGMTPVTDSQYWVAPFIQDFFTRIIVQHRPELATVIKEYTSMHLAI